jgi:hypothetical protein
MLQWLFVVLIYGLRINADSVTSGALSTEMIVGSYQLVRMQSFLPTRATEISTALCPILDTSDAVLLPPFLTTLQGDQCQDAFLNRMLPSEVTMEVPLGESYEFEARFARGAHGELWIARKVNNVQSTREQETEFVLKRIFSSQMKRVALREIYFGRLLATKKVPRVAHLVEWFEKDDDLWLVYRNEGVSLVEWMYSMDQSGVRQTSPNWVNMKRKSGGQEILQILKDVARAVNALHALGITHRDIKVRI